jgi:hypothetical protein
MNSVHEHHRPEYFAGLNPYVFPFHDSTFECVARSLVAVEIDGPLTKVTQGMALALQAR